MRKSRRVGREWRGKEGGGGGGGGGSGVALVDSLIIGGEEVRFSPRFQIIGDHLGPPWAVLARGGTTAVHPTCDLRRRSMWGLERTRGGGGPVWTVDGAAVTACASAEGGGGGGGRLWRHRPPPWGLGRAGWGGGTCEGRCEALLPRG